MSSIAHMLDAIKQTMKKSLDPSPHGTTTDTYIADSREAINECFVLLDSLSMEELDENDDIAVLRLRILNQTYLLCSREQEEVLNNPNMTDLERHVRVKQLHVDLKINLERASVMRDIQMARRQFVQSGEDVAA